MPSLGFNCPKCKLNYGSIRLYTERSVVRRGNLHRILSQKNEVGRKEARERTKVKPVEYALFNRILSEHEIKWAKTVAESLQNPQFCAMLASMSQSDKQKLIELVNNTSSHIRARNASEQRNKINKKEWHQNRNHRYERWNIVEKIDRGSWFHKMIVMNDRDPDGSIKKDVVDFGMENMKKVTIQWNPICMIKMYRSQGDSIRHLHFDMDFYAKVIATYPELMAYAHKHEEKIGKAFDVINTYRIQFPNHNWRYTLYEWLWIAKYAKKEGIGKTRDMLSSLDGQAGRISRKYIKNQIDPVMKFWEDFVRYAPYFFKFLNIMNYVIAHDTKLIEENKSRTEQLEEKNLEDIKKIVKEHLDRIGQHPYTANNNDGNYGCQKCEDFNSYYNYIKAIRAGPERIQINHSNPNYQKEMEAFKKGLKKDKPRKKTVCYIDPNMLSPEIRADLHKQGKVYLW
jgi:hypothetical protein